MIPDPQPPRPLSPTLRQSPLLGPSILPNTPHPRASKLECALKDRAGLGGGRLPRWPSLRGRQKMLGRAGCRELLAPDPGSKGRVQTTTHSKSWWCLFFFFGDAFCSVFTESEPLYLLPLSAVNLIPDEQTWEVSHSPVRGTRLTRLLANAQKWLMMEGRRVWGTHNSHLLKITFHVDFFFFFSNLLLARDLFHKLRMTYSL